MYNYMPAPGAPLYEDGRTSMISVLKSPGGCHCVSIISIMNKTSTETDFIYMYTNLNLCKLFVKS